MLRVDPILVKVETTQTPLTINRTTQIGIKVVILLAATILVSWLIFNPSNHSLTDIYEVLSSSRFLSSGTALIRVSINVLNS